MKIAIWIIAICELIRLVQNTLQLMMMNGARKEENFKRATDAFIESLNKTDIEFMHDMYKQAKEQNE